MRASAHDDERVALLIADVKPPRLLAAGDLVGVVGFAGGAVAFPILLAFALPTFEQVLALILAAFGK